MIQLILINKNSIVTIQDSRLKNLSQGDNNTILYGRYPDEYCLLKLTDNSILYIERSMLSDIEGQVISAKKLSWVKIFSSIISNVRESSGFKGDAAALLLHGVDS